MSEVCVIVNPLARAGKLKNSRHFVECVLKQASLVPGAMLRLDRSTPFQEQVQSFFSRSLLRGRRRLVVIGGDGTLNFVVNQLLFWCKSHNIDHRSYCIGAVGTGSSNDFHKPCSKTFQGVPVRLNFAAMQSQDLIKIASDRGEHFAVNNIGIGFTADANQRFNQHGWWLGILKRLNADLSVFWTALIQLWAMKQYAFRLSTPEGDSWEDRLNNLGIAKNPHIAGMFRYPGLVEKDDGLLGIFGIKKCRRIKFLSILLQLLKGRFPQDSWRFSQVSDHVRLESSEEFSYEVDGEVYLSHFLALESGQITMNFAG